MIPCWFLGYVDRLVVRCIRIVPGLGMANLDGQAGIVSLPSSDVHSLDDRERAVRERSRAYVHLTPRAPTKLRDEPGMKPLSMKKESRIDPIGQPRTNTRPRFV